MFSFIETIKKKTPKFWKVWNSLKRKKKKEKEEKKFEHLIMNVENYLKMVGADTLLWRRQLDTFEPLCRPISRRPQIYATLHDKKSYGKTNCPFFLLNLYIIFLNYILFHFLYKIFSF